MLNKKRQLEEFLVEYHDAFAKHCFDVGFCTSNTSSLILTKKVQIVPQSQVLLECSLAKLSDHCQSCTGLVIPSEGLDDKWSIALTSFLSKNDDTGKVFVPAINLSDNLITLNNGPK